MDKEYKVIKSHSLSTVNDERFIIVSTVTGEVLDDAQGYGYKTPRNAHIAFGYKNKKHKQKNSNKTSNNTPEYSVPLMVNDTIIKRLSLKEIRRHEMEIIEDNVEFGYLHGYNPVEIKDYKRTAQNELNDLVKQIKANPHTTVLIIEKETQRYVIKKA